MKTLVALVFCFAFSIHFSKQETIITGKQCLVEKEIEEFQTVSTNVRGTVYHADPKQCGSEFITTASGAKIDTANAHKLRWVAVSRDLLKKGIKMGDTIYIDSPGHKAIHGQFFIVKDKMGKYHWKPVNKKERAAYESGNCDLSKYKEVHGKLCIKVKQENWIDILSHKKKGIMGSWKDLVVLKKVKKKVIYSIPS